ncbi:uncharacterized protein PAE49_019698 [Odontesthes bonariensis]|uniref:uncharacterized protein LOC142366175 n=1 Tax=Odontesthes bonariensis TaxID=219752 RepID=UPI003F58E261
MSRKKDIPKGDRPMPRIRENSRLMRTHESVVDFISGRSSGGSFMEMLAPALYGLNFLEPIENDLIYSDSDDDDNDPYPQNAANRPLEPHPQIKQLTDEEADKIAKELIQEDGRRKEKTERNKRKKMRKKEKKRLEKENAIKENLPEEEEDEEEEQQDKFDSENQGQSFIIGSNSEGKESSESDKLQMVTDGTGSDQHGERDKEEDLVEMNNHEGKQGKDLDLNNSCPASTELMPEEVSNQKPATDRKKDRNEAEVQQLEEEKPKVVEKPEVQKKEQKASKEKTVDATAEEFAKRSIELANAGNRLAASGQYEMAVRCFTDAIKYNPKEFKLFGNRSLCYERLQQFENALRDADVALSMKPNWIKGFFRKGKALCGLKRYYEASLIYIKVLQLESTSAEAAQELKRAQTLHLMEMGFSWAQCSEALKTHATLEEAVEALFAIDGSPRPGDAGASQNRAEPPVEQEEEDVGDWVVRQMSRPRTQQVGVSNALGPNGSNSQSPTPHSRSPVRPDFFPVWVGTLAPAMTYAKLHELCSRAGTVYSIKMLLEQQCAFVNYTRKEDCDRAIQCINGMVVEGAPLTVRYPYKTLPGLSAATDPFPRPGMYKKECFFWRTTGCTRDDCTFRHVPENKNIDKDKFTSRLGYGAHAGSHS